MTPARRRPAPGPGRDGPRCPGEATLTEGSGAPLPPGDLDAGQALPEIEAIIRDLAARQAQLSALITRCLEGEREADLGELVRLLGLHGQNASRLGRLLRDRQALCGGADDGFLASIGQALDELGDEWGVEL